MISMISKYILGLVRKSAEVHEYGASKNHKANMVQEVMIRGSLVFCNVLLIYGCVTIPQTYQIYRNLAKEGPWVVHHTLG